MYLIIDTVSYTHLTLPTICRVQISVVAVSLKNCADYQARKIHVLILQYLLFNQTKYILIAYILIPRSNQRSTGLNCHLICLTMTHLNITCNRPITDYIKNQSLRFSFHLFLIPPWTLLLQVIPMHIKHYYVPDYYVCFSVKIRLVS